MIPALVRYSSFFAHIHVWLLSVMLCDASTKLSSSSEVWLGRPNAQMRSNASTWMQLGYTLSSIKINHKRSPPVYSIQKGIGLSLRLNNTFANCGGLLLSFQRVHCTGKPGFAWLTCNRRGRTSPWVCKIDLSQSLLQYYHTVFFFPLHKVLILKQAYNWKEILTTGTDSFFARINKFHTHNLQRAI